jgi:IS4 transposase
LRDDIVIVAKSNKRKEYPERMRRVTALVEVNGVDVEMVFFSNNLEWAASSICDLYKCRWSIETFFKQIKQTLNLGSFLGHSQNAIQWQVWTALLMYVLLRFLHACCDWDHSFIRLFTCLRAVLWQRRDILNYLKSYGIAGGGVKLLCMPQQAFLPGFG